MLDELQPAYDTVRLAIAERNQAVARTLPVGTKISWDHPNGECFGKVLIVNGARLKVENEHTRKSYWINATDVLSVDRDDVDSKRMVSL